MKDYPFLYQSGAILLILGSALHIALWSYAPWLYALGAGLYTLYFLLQPHKSYEVRERRLIRMNLFSGLLFITSAVFLLRNSTMWILFFALAMVFAIYAGLLLVFKKKS
ncbi:hypothetical protein HQ45_07285 [Porphyromonas crevioricanis]|uniref:Uncharacterized protein n=2 Tax=Porphyromonas crevioricanis TaxID=393921 RepID=A0A0A2FZQ8_9PORP|nr:hypothetical protein [Porphyromonas crevioricanis]KGN89333.1 hypothetical protein HQ45_07285 [Porphyromonas crevioricanis]KGN93709.1 hypothetical protein HQ38_08730 [Porphyromonas crevioricanis]SKA02497.1 hypothetical protein SAMN02745203_01634 [Porphyromonas crevioricanis]SQH73117.1 Uncharacterised protein [Porphyromonas crevioricanis]GAD05846.1 hypothetical protein PORCRE_1555 [Porphyromonas crevioricanis JCM 15906]